MPEPAIGLRLDVAGEPDADAAGDSLELTHASREDLRRVVESFPARRSP